ncbi:MAG: Crp/Fnr family transcriptional regulator [Candidatus Omnitrophica bacterium]|nr:Crp/Fnr family transcriptional regulator [Candidatus Omnitrophota bacterium]
MDLSPELKAIPLFKNLSLKDLKFLNQILKERTYEKGGILFEQSEACENIIIVKSGRIKIFRLSSSGQEQILEVLHPGDTCACNPGKAEWACSSWAQALSDCTVWTLSRKHYVDMVKNNSQLAHTLSDLFAKRLCKFCALIEQVSLETPQRRLVKFLLDIFDSQESNGEQNLSFKVPFTHEEIAQRLGLVRETVSRQLSHLKKLKLIQMDRNTITICDRKALQNILS